MSAKSQQGRPIPPPPFAELTATFARVGLVSFGGPAGQIALLHRVLVEEKRWLDEARFLHALNCCMLLPGPEAMQLATYAGWLLHGVRGGLVAGLLFLLPGAVVIVGLSAIYLLAGEAPLVEGLLFGLEAAVLALIVDAVVRLSRRTLHGVWAAGVALLAFVAIALLALPFPMVVLAAAAAGVLRHFAAPEATDGTAATLSSAAPALRSALRSVVVWGGLWLVPLAGLLVWQWPAAVYAAEAAFFSKMALVGFGGVYAALAYVGQQAVAVHGWLSAGEMLTGLGLAEATPGPLILVLAFVGFLAGARQSGLEPLLGGMTGAVVALWFTFVPSFLWIFAGAPLMERLRRLRWLSAALASITAAVVGIIANLALWTGLRTLFATVGERPVGPFVLPLPDPGSFEPAAAAVALAAALALSVLRVNAVAVLAVAAALGAAGMLAI